MLHRDGHPKRKKMTVRHLNPRSSHFQYVAAPPSISHSSSEGSASICQACESTEAGPFSFVSIAESVLRSTGLAISIQSIDYAKSKGMKAGLKLMVFWVVPCRNDEHGPSRQNQTLTRFTNFTCCFRRDFLAVSSVGCTDIYVMWSMLMNAHAVACE